MSMTIDLEEILGDAPLLRVSQPRMSHAQFVEFVRHHPDLEVERTAEGELLFRSPTGAGTGARNSALTRYLDEWAERDGTGIAFDSSTLFHLPLGSDRSPDASWVSRDRWDALSAADQEAPSPLCPDFVVELMSPTDRLSDAQEKMDEYMANGARLGWLIDRRNRRVHVYRPSQDVVELDDPAEVSGDPELPGFVLRLARIF